MFRFRVPKHIFGFRFSSGYPAKSNFRRILPQKHCLYYGVIHDIIKKGKQKGVEVGFCRVANDL